MTLKLGGKIGEYRLAKIADDRITLEAAGDSFEVLLNDPKKAKTRVRVRAGIQSSEVKPAQPAPASPPTVDSVKAESMEKPVEPAKEKVITHASPIANKDILISRSRRSEAIRQRMGSGQQSGAESTPSN
jgi:hypothetical protein